MTALGQIAVWAGLWCFWVFISRNNHPTLLLDGIATGLLLMSFAAAIYLNWLVLVPRFWHRRQFLLYWISLAFTACALSAIVVVLIQKVYDVLWGPDPRRFGFWMNYGLDFTGVWVHLAATALVLRLIQKYSRYI